MDCLFCKIGKKEIPAEFVYEDDHAFGILDINPIAPGHTMIIPKVHSENLIDLPAEEIGPVFLAVKKCAENLSHAFKPEGFTLGINHGRVSGQLVDHLHIHIVPRFAGDGGGSVHSVVNNPPKESLEAIAKKIRNSVIY